VYGNVRRTTFIFGHTQKRLTHFTTKSSEIIISSITAGSTFQKRSLPYNFDFVDNVEFCYTGFIRYANNNKQVLFSKNVFVHVW
jgi:hypothetical protein